MENKGAVFIIGPMRGYKYYNFPAFHDAEKRLRDEGWEVISPANLDKEDGLDVYELSEDHDWNREPAELSLGHCLQRNINGIISSDAVYLLNGWMNSSMGLVEKQLAEYLEREIIYEPGAEPPSTALDEAQNLVYGERQGNYGHPYVDYSKTAKMWSGILGIDVSVEQAVMCMAAVKMSRELNKPKRDNRVDLAGYAECLNRVSELSTEEKRNLLQEAGIGFSV